MANTVRSLPCPITALAACMHHTPLPGRATSGILYQWPVDAQQSQLSCAERPFAAACFSLLGPVASVCLTKVHMGPLQLLVSAPDQHSHTWPLHTPEMLNLYAPATYPRQQQPAAVVTSCLTCLLHAVLRSALFTYPYLPLAVSAVFPLCAGSGLQWWLVASPPPHWARARAQPQWGCARRWERTSTERCDAYLAAGLSSSHILTSEHILSSIDLSGPAQQAMLCSCPAV